MNNETELINGGKYHTHRTHMINRYGYIMCGKNKSDTIGYTTDPSLVNCKSCLYKMGKGSKE